MKPRVVALACLLVGAVIGAIATSSLRAQTTGPVYFVAENDVIDAAGYRAEYLPRAQASIKAHGGRYLAAGTATPFAGDPPKSRVVIQVWDNMQQLEAWFNSPEYREARRIGEKYAKFRNYAIPGSPQ